jgi:hypothetical protein
LRRTRLRMSMHEQVRKSIPPLWIGNNLDK